MIWFRRILIIPLIILFVALFTIALLGTQVNDTVANPGFYNDQMLKADIYNFVYDDALPAALDEIGTDDSSDSPIHVSAIEDEIVSAARKILPPEWLQAQFESATNSMIPYIVNNADHFTYTLALRDRVKTAAEVIKDDIIQGNAFTSIYDDGMSYLADELFENLDELPYSLTLSKEQIENSLRTVVPEDWINSQVEAAVDSVTRYMTGESNHFTITVHLRDRVDATAAVVIELFSEQETYDYLLDEMITPTIEANLGPTVNLPFGVTLNQEEITSAIKEVLPQPWVQARLNEVINGIAAYVKGEAESIEATIDLADRKAIALDVLTELADQKLQSLFLSLPVCSITEFLQIAATLPPGTLPGCRPPDVSYQEAKGLLNIDLANSVDQMIGDQIPDQWVYTDADLRQSLGEDHEEFLDEARDWVINGWTFTDADLLDELNSDEEETLEDVRSWIGSGYTVTETDLREAIADTDEDLESFDDARSWAGTAGTWLWSIWLISLLLLLLIGFLGGVNWKSRLAWALVVLFLTSLAVYTATGLTYSHIVEPRVQEIIDPTKYQGLEAVMAEKGNEVIENLFGSFASGMKGKALYMMIGPGLVLLGIIGWSMASQRREKETD